ncbi:Uma2 family endonuclease [Geminocystis sp. CENA526]|uniref:Uma2 family endonuclease n=1 Tax=Geminocystis sp. CENA526 TaxID=1355871 RepID=UPI003D6FD928
MTTAVLTPSIVADDVFNLEGISWDTYMSLWQDLSESRRLKLTYYHGNLEIMSPSPEHEYYKRIIGRFIETLAEELDINISPLGSTTFKLLGYGGAEPDDCFYIENIDLIRNVKKFKPDEAIPPDLILEIDLISPSNERLKIYQELGVKEVWVYTRDGLQILQLKNNEYIQAENSIIFPNLPLLEIDNFMTQLDSIDYLDLVKMFRQWVREKIHKD